MPRHTAAAVRWSELARSYEILTQGKQDVQAFSLEYPAWETWLENISSFAFRSHSGAYCTVRKEAIQGRGNYWYAYRSVRGRTLKRYLGKTADLTLLRLEEVAERFTRPLSSRQVSVSETLLPVAEPLSGQTIAPQLSPLLLSRLYPPRLPLLLLERPALSARLDGWRAYKLTLLAASAGFGKTTLVNAWLRERQKNHNFSHVAWISLETSDDNLCAFWRLILTACQNWLEESERATLMRLLAASYLPAGTLPVTILLTHFLNGIVGQVTSGLLVLDSYHLLEDSHLHQSMAFFLEHLPAQVHVMLLSRGEPPLPLVRWRVQGMMQEFHSTDLRFSLDETTTFLRLTTALAPSMETIKQLDASLEGWPAGLRLLSLTHQGIRSFKLAKQTPYDLPGNNDLAASQLPLLDYLVTEVLEAQPARLQEFLLQTSFLKSLNSSLCAFVTEREQGRELLDVIARAGLFLEELEGEKGWYRYHPLFAEALRREAQSRLTPADLHRLALRASRWYAQHSLITEAIESALQTDDIELVVSLIEQDTFMQGAPWELPVLRRWLAHMPEEILQFYPTLCLLAGMILWFSHEEEAGSPLSSQVRARMEHLFDLAEVGWQRQGRNSWPGIIYTFRAISYWRSNAFEPGARYAFQALTLLAEDDPDSRIQMCRRICLFIVGIENMQCNKFIQASELFQQALIGIQAYGNRPFARGVALMRATVLEVLGELCQAVEGYRQVLADARDEKDRDDALFALLGLARISFDQNDLAIAEQYCREAYSLTEAKDQEQRDRSFFQLALVYYAQGQTALAQQQIAALLARLRLVPPSSSHWPLLPEAQFWHLRWQIEMGDVQGVQRHMQGAIQHLSKLSSSQQMFMCLLQVRLYLAQGKTREAHAELQPMLPIVQELGVIRSQIELHILQALTFADEHKVSESYHWLQQALLLARSEGFLRLFLNEGGPLRRLLRGFLRGVHDPSLRSFAQRILQAFSSIDAPLSAVPPLVESQLTRQEQRILRLLRDGQTNTEIAEALVISVNTVKDHIRHLYHKLNVSNRLEASQAAQRLGL